MVLLIGQLQPHIKTKNVELRTRLGETPHTWIEWSCSQLLQNTPLHPIADWGRQRDGSADVPAEQRLADLENSLTQIKLDPAENAPLLAPLLEINSIPAGPRPGLSAGRVTTPTIVGDDGGGDGQCPCSAGSACR